MISNNKSAVFILAKVSIKATKVTNKYHYLSINLLRTSTYEENELKHYQRPTTTLKKTLQKKIYYTFSTYFLDLDVIQARSQGFEMGGGYKPPTLFRLL